MITITEQPTKEFSETDSFLPKSMWKSLTIHKAIFRTFLENYMVMTSTLLSDTAPVSIGILFEPSAINDIFITIHDQPGKRFNFHLNWLMIIWFLSEGSEHQVMWKTVEIPCNKLYRGIFIECFHRKIKVLNDPAIIGS